MNELDLYTETDTEIQEQQKEWEQYACTVDFERCHDEVSAENNKAPLPIGAIDPSGIASSVLLHPKPAQEPPVSQSSNDWPDPIPFSDTLPKVMSLRPEMLPRDIGDHIFDVADRQNSPPDFGATTGICALSSLLGNKIVIKPKQNDDWIVVPTQWGINIGNPSTKKTPSMQEALKPLTQIDEFYSDQYDIESKRHRAELELVAIAVELAKINAKKLLKTEKKSDREKALQVLESARALQQAPTRKRYIMHDSTVEKTGVLLNENPNGFLLSQDELSSWFSKMEKDEYQGDRAFYLQCFNGNGSYSYDRITRESIHIKNCTLSIVGGIQPSRIRSIVCKAVRGMMDDELIQRFQLAVWPDPVKQEWQDRAPNKDAWERYKRIFDKIDALVKSKDIQCVFHFTAEGQALANQFMIEQNSVDFTQEVGQAFESHLTKMPKTIFGLALLFQIVEDLESDYVGANATVMALSWFPYLKSHAERLYSVVGNQCIENARLILSRRAKLKTKFTARHIKQKGWIPLYPEINDALECLVDHQCLRVEESIPQVKGGRPSTFYYWNPKIGGV